MVMYDPTEQQQLPPVKAFPVTKTSYVYSKILKPYRLRSVLAFVGLLIMSIAGIIWDQQAHKENVQLSAALAQLNETSTDPHAEKLIALPPEPSIPITYNLIDQKNLTQVLQVDLKDLINSWTKDDSNKYSLTGNFTFYGMTHTSNPEEGVILAFRPSDTDCKCIILLYQADNHHDVSQFIQTMRIRLPEHINLLDPNPAGGVPYLPMHDSSFTNTVPQWTITDIRPQSASLPPVLFVYDSNLNDFAACPSIEKNQCAALLLNAHNPDKEQLSKLEADYHLKKQHYDLESADLQQTDTTTFNTLTEEYNRIQTLKKNIANQQ